MCVRFLRTPIFNTSLYFGSDIMCDWSCYRTLRNQSPCQEGLRERPPLSREPGALPYPQIPFRASGSPDDHLLLPQQRLCPQQPHLLQAPLCLHFRKLLWTGQHALDPGLAAQGQSLPLTLSSRLRTGFLSCPIHVYSKAASWLPLLR